MTIDMYEVEKMIALARKDPKRVREIIKKFNLFKAPPITHLVGALMICKQNERCVIRIYSQLFREKYLLDKLQTHLVGFVRELKKALPIANKAINQYFDHIREKKARIEDEDANIDKVVLGLINRSKTKNVFRDMEQLQVKHIRALLSRGSYINALFNIMEKTYEMSMQGELNAIQAFTYTHEKIQEMLHKEEIEVKESDFLKSQLLLEKEIKREREMYSNRVITDDILKDV